MGRYGFDVIDADGHGGEPLDWRRRIPDRFRTQMVEYVRALKDHYGITGRNVPGGGMQVNDDNPAATTWSDDDFELGPPSSMRPGMYDPEARRRRHGPRGHRRRGAVPARAPARSSRCTTATSPSRCAAR